MDGLCCGDFGGGGGGLDGGGTLNGVGGFDFKICVGVGRPVCGFIGFI